MKSTLTSDDPSGWYLCICLTTGEKRVRWFSGIDVLICPSSELPCSGRYKDYARLYTESDVAALRQALAENEALVAESVKGAEQVNEELRTLREELDKQKEKWRILNRDYGIRIDERNSLQGKLEVCEKYAASFQKQCDDYLGELRKAREENATLERQADSLLKQAEQLEAGLSRLKSQPYEMRRAERPDCVGLWRNVVGQICRVETESDLDGYGGCPPYYYLGPIPVVVEQQPPKVVKVRYMDNEYDAIRVRHFGFVLLGHDGNGERYVTKEESEEVQS